MNANLIKLITAIIMVALTIILSTVETIGTIGFGLYMLTMIFGFIVIGVEFKVTKEKPEDWDGA